jgi:hypothetical protein
MDYGLLEFVCDIARKRKFMNYRLSHQSILPYLYHYTYQNLINSWKPYCVVSFNMGWDDISKFYPPTRYSQHSIASMNYFLIKLLYMISLVRVSFNIVPFIVAIFFSCQK